MVVFDEEGVDAAVGGVARCVADDGVFGDVEDGSADHGVVAGIAAQVVAHLGAGPGEGAAVALVEEVGSRHAPDLTGEADDLAREVVVDGCVRFHFWFTVYGLRFTVKMEISC